MTASNRSRQWGSDRRTEPLPAVASPASDLRITLGRVGIVVTLLAWLAYILYADAIIAPVGTGLVASLARPGGNITGLAVLNAETSSKRLQLLREVVPGLSQGAVLWNAANPANGLAWKETEGAARALGVALQSDEVRTPQDFDGAFANIVQQHPDILLVLQDALTLEHRKEIIDFTLREKLPTMFVGKEWVEEGGLMSYGDRLPERYRRAADLVDRILKGAKPADLPVEQPTTFELVVNLKTAKAMGLTLPPTFLARADQVIE